MATEVTLVLRFEEDLDENDVQSLEARAEEEFECTSIETTVEEC